MAEKLSDEASHKRPSKYDWSLLILQLRRHGGMSYEAIAGYLDVDESTPRQWVSRNQCPRYDDGEWLIETFRALVGDEVPLMKEEPMERIPVTGAGGREAALSVRYRV